jgi:ubiquitin C-terminal hydrolase
LHIQAFATVDSSFDNCDQHDAHEFFLALVNILWGDDQEQSPFALSLKSALKCPSCKAMLSSNIESYQCIEVELLAGTTSLVGCLNSYFTAETVVSNLECRCKQSSSEQSKQLSIVQAPRVLMLLLKRFKFDISAQKQIKETKKVDITVDLNLTKFLDEGDYGIKPCLYDLKAVSCHFGTGLKSGHYTVRFVCHYLEMNLDNLVSSLQAFVRGTTVEDWWECNDSEVRMINQLEMKATVENDGYLFFYERREDVIRATPPRPTQSIFSESHSISDPAIFVTPY